MESPIDVVRRFCAAWSDNVSTVELAAFFTDDAELPAPRIGLIRRRLPCRWK